MILALRENLNIGGSSMRDFLEEVLALYGARKFVPQSEELVKEGERVYGILSGKSLKWYAVWIAYQDKWRAQFEQDFEEMKDVIENLPKELTSEQWAERREQEILFKEHKLVYDIFMLALKKAFPALAILPKDEKPVVCRGWRVVVRRFPKDEENLRQNTIVVSNGHIVVRELAGIPTD